MYHLEHPNVAIKNLSSICKDMFIISTATNGNNDGFVLVDEHTNDKSQCIPNTKACRAGRLYYHNELSKYFDYIYYPKSQPEHEWFKKDWSKPVNKLPTRHPQFFIIIASKTN